MAQTSNQVIPGTLENPSPRIQILSISDSILRATASPDHVLEVRMPLFSKARPRLTRFGKAYMPQAYKDSQAEMRRQLASQWTDEPLTGPMALYLRVYGEGRGDTDNIAGAIMDAANGILWTDDRVSIISTLVVEWVKASKADSRWIIQIAELT